MRTLTSLNTSLQPTVQTLYLHTVPCGDASRDYRQPNFLLITSFKHDQPEWLLYLWRHCLPGRQYVGTCMFRAKILRYCSLSGHTSHIFPFAIVVV